MLFMGRVYGGALLLLSMTSCCRHGKGLQLGCQGEKKEERNFSAVEFVHIRLYTHTHAHITVY